MGGRKYHGEGELFEYDVFSSTVQAKRPDGAELFTEKFVIEPHAHNVRQVGVMGTFDVFANVLLLTPKHHADKVFEQVPAVVNLEEQWAAGAVETTQRRRVGLQGPRPGIRAGPGQGARVLVYCPPIGNRSTSAPQIRVALTSLFVASKQDLEEGRIPI